MISFRRLAPNIAGIARKNVNSAATSLDTPISSAPTIVAPDLDVPRDQCKHLEESNPQQHLDTEL